jgi:hypothetical protein
MEAVLLQHALLSHRHTFLTLTRHDASAELVSIDGALKTLNNLENGTFFICSGVDVKGFPSEVSVQGVYGDNALCYIPDEKRKENLLTPHSLDDLLTHCSGVYITKRYRRCEKL